MFGTALTVAVLYVIGIGLAIYLHKRRKANLHALAESTVDIEPIPA